MKQLWTADKLGESWALSHDDFVLARNHLGFAFQLYAKFVDGYREMAGDVTGPLSEPPMAILHSYEVTGPVGGNSSVQMRHVREGE